MFYCIRKQRYALNSDWENYFFKKITEDQRARIK